MKALVAFALLTSLTAFAQQQPAQPQGQPALLALPHSNGDLNDAPQVVIGNVVHTLNRNSVDPQTFQTINYIFGNPSIPTYVVNRNKRFFSVRVVGQCVTRQQVMIAGTAAFRDSIQPLNGQCPSNARLQITQIVPVQPNEVTSVGDAAVAVVADNRTDGKDVSNSAQTGFYGPAAGTVQE